ncbi:MAG: hypothetical protein NXI09_14180 [Bacteroidetes bacterium]|nr:hypothetical protein [Bacteroidota bacterium]
MYIAIILLDLNEFVTRSLGSESVLTTLIFIISLFLIFSARPLTGTDGRLNRAFLVAFFGFLFLGGIASIIEGDSSGLFKDVRYYLPSVLIYFSTYRSVMSIRSEGELYRIISIAAILIGFNAILILVSIGFNIDFHGSTGLDQVERAVGLYSNANRAGYVSTIGQSLALLLLFSGAVKRPNFYFWLYVLCLLAALSTFSKGTILLSMLLILRLLYLGLVNRDLNIYGVRRYIRRFAVMFGLILLGLAFGLLNLQSRLSDLQSQRISQVQLLLQGQIDRETTTHRSELAVIALEEMRETFFLGAGLGKFKKMDIGNGTHNVYLLILGEAGVIALILYLLFYVKWAKNSFAGRQFSSLRFASGNIMILFFFSGFVAHTLLANKPYILSLALILAALRIDRTIRMVQVP